MFNTVYSIAVQSNSFEELKRRLRGLPIDAMRMGYLPITAAAQLAREGMDERVEWMIKLGASRVHIAAGYALEKRFDKLCVKGLTRAVQAACYALAGWHEKVDTCWRFDGASIVAIAKAYVLVGNAQKVEEFIKLGVDEGKLVESYVLAGNTAKVAEWQKRDGKRTVTAIACAHAKACHYAKVEEFIGVPPDAIACAYAEVGAHGKVEEYQTQYQVSFYTIACAYGRVNNFEKKQKYSLLDLLETYMKKRKEVKDSSGKTKEYFYGSFFSYFQKSFTQKNKAVDALMAALNGEKVDLSEHLSTLRNGNLGTQLRTIVKSGQCNALVGKEVSTVSEFVQALQDKISNPEQLFTTEQRSPGL